MKKNQIQPGSVLLAVQGEGRGHLTQAMAVYELLLNEGIEVCCVVVGSSVQRDLPGFFTNHFKVPVIALLSPNFVKDEQNKSVRVGASIWHNMLNAGSYLRSMRIIRRLVKFHRPACVVNFYEPLMGLYKATFGTGTRMISIAHQYVYLHPAFRIPWGSRPEKWMLRQYTRMTALGSDRVLAISMYALPHTGSRLLQTIPPVLRPAVFSVSPTRENFILAYVLNEGYMNEIIAWHLRHPEVELHCFTDSRTVKEIHRGKWQWDERLCFHSLNDHQFLAMLASCSAVATTAGFETVCEAFYLGKPVLMVPVAGHLEQQCNARDASRFGAGVYSDHFQLDRLLDVQARDNGQFRAWVESSGSMIMDIIRQLAGKNQSPSPEQERPVMEMRRQQALFGDVLKRVSS